MGLTNLVLMSLGLSKVCTKGLRESATLVFPPAGPTSKNCDSATFLGWQDRTVTNKSRAWRTSGRIIMGTRRFFLPNTDMTHSLKESNNNIQDFISDFLICYGKTVQHVNQYIQGVKIIKYNLNTITNRSS